MQVRYIDLHSAGTRVEVIGGNPIIYDEFDEDFVVRFNYQTRFIDNYLSKAIRKYHIYTDGSYNMIEVLPTRHNAQHKSLGYPQNEVAWVHLSDEEYDSFMKSTSLRARYEFYLSLLERGYEIINRHKAIPVKSLLECHEAFRKNDYKNEWLFKRLRIVEYKLSVELLCFFTTYEFRLELRAINYKTNGLVAEGLILRTTPDEISYAHTFKSASIIEDRIIIYDFLKHPAFIIDIPKLLYGVVEVKYLKYEKDEDADEIARLIW